VTFTDCELNKKSDYSIIIEDAKEKSITATTSVTSFTVILLGLIFKLSKKEQMIQKLMIAGKNFYKNFEKYSDYISVMINNENINKFIFLGAGPLYGVAKEAELKVKEMSRSNTEVCQPLEYRHGHKSIINSECMIIFLISNIGFNYELETIKELKKLGGKILVVCDDDKKIILEGLYDYIITTNFSLNELLKPVFYQLFGQLIGYHQAVKKGIDPSNPKNLDYCVTLTKQ
jgi:glucosamine--fructose-6-phosphate aminotransferase (isomerizing)